MEELGIGESDGVDFFWYVIVGQLEQLRATPVSVGAVIPGAAIYEYNDVDVRRVAVPARDSRQVRRPVRGSSARGESGL